MKPSVLCILTALLSLVSAPAFSAQYLDSDAQLALVNQLAKETRRELYQSSHTDVGTSDPVIFKKSDLDAHYAARESHEQTLSSEDYAKLYQCVNSKTCALWSYDSWSSFMSGTGASTHFVMINTRTGSYKVIEHETYAE